MLRTTRSALSTRSAGLALVLACGLAFAAPDVGAPGAQPLPAQHAATCTQCNHGDGLPTYDIRIDDAVYSAIAGTIAQGAADKALASAAALRAALPTLAIDFDEALGTPKFIRSTAGFLSGQHPGAAWPVIAGGFVAANRALCGFDASELTGNRVTRDFVSASNGVRSLTVQQVHAGVDIFGATVRASVTSRGELVNLSSTMLDRPVDGFSPAAAKVSAARAITIAAADAGVAVAESDLSVLEDEAGPDRRAVWKTPSTLRPDEPLVTSLVYFPLSRTTLVPAWAVVIPQHGLGHAYDTLIDATDGKVLFRSNRLVCAGPITFNVFTDDSPAPMSPGLFTTATTQAPLVSRNIVTVTPAEVAAWSPLSWIT
ncbi:MAG: hypothetical protein Q8L55_13390, partial [Phycisphaerales bacterium]|nr:hypothetical protein [Phycisphaerales bacterium]